MTTKDVAKRLVMLCKEGKFGQAKTELYSPYAVSIEPAGTPFPEVCDGLKAMEQKSKKWNAMITKVHGVEISDVAVAGNFFSLKMENDVEMKGMGRQKSEEICMYHVRDGKIISEQFFYDPKSNKN